VAIRVRHDPTNALEAHNALTQYVTSVEVGDLDADELTGLLSKASDALDAEVHALRRTLGR
jgi:hypothetical protein